MLVRLFERNSYALLAKAPNFSTSLPLSSDVKQSTESGTFRVLDIKSKKKVVPPRRDKKMPVPPPRYTEMAVNQDWSSVWPGPRTFHPAVVPLPIRQGYPYKRNAPFGKFANAELMKVPNFLHLTPPAIAKHCEALKQFCTKWPEGLETDESHTQHFPLEVITSDYCYSSPSIRDPLARIVSLRVKLSSLPLNAHAKDKLLRLVKEKYNPETDLITITADRCPLRKQNLEYAEFILTALFHESWRVEAWEAEKGEVDMEYYDWDKSESRKTLATLHSWPEPPTDLNYENIPHATEYKTVVSDLINNGENENSINNYREVVKNILHLKN